MNGFQIVKKTLSPRGVECMRPLFDALKGVTQPTAEEERVLLTRIATGDSAARDEMVLRNMALVISIAGMYTSNGVPMDELVSIGTLGLIKALDRWDHTKRNRFSTYATDWIRTPVQRTAMAHMRRTPVDSLDEPLGESSNLYGVTPDPVVETEQVEAREQVASLLGVLTEQELCIITHRYGLDGSSNKTLEEVGALVGLTRERVRQIEQSARTKMLYAANGSRINGAVLWGNAERMADVAMHLPVETVDCDDDAVLSIDKL